jgi:hypothetical protein
MTRAEHAQRIRELAIELYKADYGMGMPRDYKHVYALRVALVEALAAAELDMILSEFE